MSTQTPPLRLLMVSSSYPRNSTDWRGLFIKHLVNALATLPDINLNLWAPPGEIPATVTYACLPQESIWLHTLIERGGIAHILRTGKLSRFTTPTKLLLLLRHTYQRQHSTDLFHINWLQNALPLLGTSHPALISVLGSDLKLLKLPLMIRLLRQVLKQRRSILAPNAEWMTTELEQHFGDITRIVPISFGIDQAWYTLTRNQQHPMPKKWLIVSRVTKNKIGHLFEWSESIPRQQHELHLFGPQQEPLEIPHWIHYHGPTYPHALYTQWFPHATGLITLSQHDEGRPQIMLEAMAAGLPIIASRLPAHTTLITHRHTGWLTDSQADFITAINWLSQPEHNAFIATQARAWVKDHIGTWEDCAQRYITAYHHLLE